MNQPNEFSVLKRNVDNRLQRIANVLLLNSSFTDNLGLLYGKMGIAIFFYQYGRYTGNKIYSDYAGELIDEIYEEINPGTSVGFEDGLTGIGWGIEYLVRNNFVQADTDEALSEIDTSVYRNSLYTPFLLENDKDLFGYGLYYIARLREHENDDENLNTLFKKQHLIYLTDDIERILVQRSYLKFNIQSLSTDTVNSFLWFLLEMHSLELFPFKVEKLFHCLPEYIESCLQSSHDIPGKSLLLMLTENIIPCIADKDLQRTFRTILKETTCIEPDKDIIEDALVDGFIKNIWQQLIYAPYITEQKATHDDLGKIFLIIESEVNWNRRLDNLNKNNLGLTGLAGIGLGLLRAQGEERKTRQGNRTKKGESSLAG